LYHQGISHSLGMAKIVGLVTALVCYGNKPGLPYA
jgi:hypothetical protein